MRGRWIHIPKAHDCGKGFPRNWRKNPTGSIWRCECGRHWRLTSIGDLEPRTAPRQPPPPTGGGSTSKCN